MEQRKGDRRGDERRVYRRDEGRRDDEVDRRRGFRRWVAPILLLSLPLFALLAWRTAIVAPRRAAEVRAAGFATAVDAAVAAAGLPMLMLAGSPPPTTGQPGDALAPLGVEARGALEEADTTLSPSLRAAPTVAAIPSTVAPARFLLGREREARHAWESLLSVGDPEDVSDARIGLAVVAIRAAARQSDEQDRAFALDEAQRHLAEVPDALEAKFDRAVVLGMAGRTDEARAAAEALPAPLSTPLMAWLSEESP